MFFLVVCVILINSVNALSIEKEVRKDSIVIAVSDGDYRKTIEFNGPGTVGRTVEFDCDGDCSGSVSRTVQLEGEVGIYIPGVYTFTISPVAGEKINTDFTLELSDVNSCEVSGDYVKTGECVFGVTGDVNDKPQACVDGGLINACGGLFNCGCADPDVEICSDLSGECVLTHCRVDDQVVESGECAFSVVGDDSYRNLVCGIGSFNTDCRQCSGECFDGEICCQNENLDECGGRLGECVVPGEERELKEEITEIINVITEETITIGEDIFEGYDLNGVIIPNGICVNSVVSVDPNDELFAMQASCSLTIADLDGDGFDSTEFVGGRDCDDTNPEVHPLVVESCELDNGYDGIDNNCDNDPGDVDPDPDCSAICSEDTDNSYPSDLNIFAEAFCEVLGYDSGDCNDNDADIYSGNSETCGDLKDNNCDGVVDNPDVCVCEAGDTRPIPGTTSDGEEQCVDGRDWVVTVAPNNNPYFLVNTPSGSVEDGTVSLVANEEFIVEVEFLCPGDDCDVGIE